MDFFNIAGFGTILYGTRDRDKSDRSYTTTAWITLLYLPVIPLGSYRAVLGEQSGVIIGVQVGYSRLDRIDLNVRQVINTYLLWYMPILAVVAALWWLSAIPVAV